MVQQEYSRARLTREATLSEEDLVEIRRCRRPANRLGFAYQIVFARLHNRLPEQQPLEINEDLLSFTAKQLEIDADQIDEYGNRQHTVSDHQARIRSHLGSRPFDSEAVQQLDRFIVEESRRAEQAEALLGRARQFLRDRGILLPADYALNRIIGEQRKLARQEVYRRIGENMSDSTRKSLDDLLNVPLGKRKSPLQRLKANPSKASPDAIVALTDKIDTIRDTGALDTDLSWLSSNYQRSLYHYVRARTVHRLKLVESDRRYSSLVCFLWQSYRDSLDQLIDMFDKLMTRMNTKAEKELDKKMRSQRKAIKASMETLKTVGEVLLDKGVDDAELRSVIFLPSPEGKIALGHRGDRGLGNR